MKKNIVIGLAVLLIVSLGLVTLSKEKVPPFIEMEVKGVRIDPVSQSPVVILSDKDGKKALPIWIGLLEANAIDKELKQVSSPRPMTHDLLHSILTQAHVKVKEVKIVDLKEQTYFATLFLTLNKGLIEIDARPSDAIILALKSRVPILVSAKVLDQQGLALSRQEGIGERHGIRIQELTPSLASHFNFRGQKGVLVSEVLTGSISEASGIKAGDIITKINLKEVGGLQEFEEIFDALKPGSAIRIVFFRDEKFQEVNLSTKP
ncbi:MAG: PDZ domain-containing protein [Deltaproteobacteria bacterium]|nr:PDZ domain-containing protein [Deltaproteobacteria bacterium]